MAPPLALTLTAVFLFQAANMGLGAYVIELGRAYGLETNFIALTLGAANWIGALGSALVAAFGARFGRVRLLAVGMALTLAGTWAFQWSALPFAFLAANISAAITWACC